MRRAPAASPFPHRTSAYSCAIHTCCLVQFGFYSCIASRCSSQHPRQVWLDGKSSIAVPRAVSQNLTKQCHGLVVPRPQIDNGCRKKPLKSESQWQITPLRNLIDKVSLLVGTAVLFVLRGEHHDDKDIYESKHAYEHDENLAWFFNRRHQVFVQS